MALVLPFSRSLAVLAFYLPSLAIAQSIATTTALNISPNPLAPGAVATLTATVQIGSTPVAGGTVTFLNGQRILGTAQVVASGTIAGTASIKTRSFVSGQHSITAVYGGAPNGPQQAAASASAAAALSVQGQLAPTITFEERPDRAAPGTYDLTAIVTGSGLQPAPTGTVTFSNGGTTLGSAPLGGQQTTQSFAATPAQYTVPSSINQFVTADFNNDGTPDLAGVSYAAAVTAVLGSPSSPGTFLTPFAVPISESATAIVAGDFNNDGLPDIAVLHQTTVGILLADPSNPGQFLAERTLATPNNPRALLAADFNRDGVLDLAILNTTGNTVGILLGSTSALGTFSLEKDYPVPGIGSAFAAGDFNGDGIPDVAVASSSYSHDSGLIAVLSGDPSHPGALLSARVAAYTGLPATTLAVADFNQDGAPDIAFANPQAGGVRLSVLPGDPSHPGQFLSITPGPVAIAQFPVSAILAADFNHDGLPDLAIAGTDGTDVLLNQPSTPGQFVVSYTNPQELPISLLAADLNGDEIPDLVIGLSQGLGASFEVVLSNLTTSAGATISSITLPAGPDQLTASYSGDSNFSSPTAASNITGPQSTVISLAISPSGSAVKGTAVTLTATVSLNSQAVTAGKVRFLDGKRFLGASQVTSAGTAILKTASFNPGAHSLTAVFEGAPHAAQGGLGASVSSAVALTVTGQQAAAATLIATTLDKNLVNYNFNSSAAAFGLTPPTERFPFKTPLPARLSLVLQFQTPLWASATCLPFSPMVQALLLMASKSIQPISIATVFRMLPLSTSTTVAEYLLGRPKSCRPIDLGILYSDSFADHCLSHRRFQWRRVTRYALLSTSGQEAGTNTLRRPGEPGPI